MLASVHHLVGPAEIAQMLGVSRQRVTQLVARPTFPSPEVVLSMGSVWKREDVARWATERGRQVH